MTVRPPPGKTLRAHRPRPNAISAPHRRRPARPGTVWADVPAVVESRWRGRFGVDAVDGLRHVLTDLFEMLPHDPPAYLPIVFPTANGRAEPLPPRAQAQTRAPSGKAGPQADLPALLSGVLLSFTVDFEAEARIVMPIGANTLRVPVTGVRSGAGSVRRDLPRLTGVSKEANAQCTGWLERHGCAEVVAVPSGVRAGGPATAKGQGGQAKHRRLLGSTEAGPGVPCTVPVPVERLAAALAWIVGDGTLTSSPLAAGLEPPEGSWRASVRRPATLPHYPMVLHRGGYPDGS